MGYQIIKQPDDRYALFSSYTDTIVAWNASAPEVIDWFAEQAEQDARVTAAKYLGHVAGGHPERAYHQFAMTWDEALEADHDHGGEVRQEWKR